MSEQLPDVDNARGPLRRRSDEAERAGSAPDRSDPRSQALIGLQRSVGNRGVAEALDADEERSPIDGVIGSGRGRPLDDTTRGAMESALGADFGSVRVHTDAPADASARQLQATAYTVGDDVVFRSGAYAPETGDGRRLLAHELTHVTQQRSGPVDGAPGPGGVSVSDPSDRFERAAEASADQVVASGAAPSVQRQAAEEEEREEAVPGQSVQRQEDEEREEPAP